MKIVVLDKSVVTRRKLLGEIGENIAQDILTQNGFISVKNINQTHLDIIGSKSNFPYADFYAERNNVKYTISVKIRNKYQFSKNGKSTINPYYNLGSKCYENAETALRNCMADKAAWLAIVLERNIFNAYFGLLESLGGRRSVKMTEEAFVNYECLAHNISHDFDYEKLKNTYQTR